MTVLNNRRLFARLLREQAPADAPPAGGGNRPAATQDPAAAPAGQAAAPAAAPAQPQTQATAPAWHESIADEGLKAFIQGKGFKDASEAAKALQDLEGRTAKPASADEYQLPVPDGQDKAFSAEAAKWMHEAGIPVSQARSLAEKWNAYQAAQVQAADAARQQQGESDVQALKQEWGGQYDANVELAKRAVRTFGADEQTLEKISGALGDGETLRFFHRIGAHLGEGTLVPGGGDRGAAPSGDPEAARAARMFPSMRKTN